MILTYQQAEALKEKKTAPARTATVEAVYGDGLTLRFDGEEQTGAKKYRYNKSVTFQPGQRVFLLEAGGTYVVGFPV